MCLPECFQICTDLDTATLAGGRSHWLDQKVTNEKSKSKKYRNIQGKANNENLVLQPPIQVAEQPTA
jgi:hypothetical protein